MVQESDRWLARYRAISEGDENGLLTELEGITDEATGRTAPATPKGFEYKAH